VFHKEAPRVPIQKQRFYKKTQESEHIQGSKANKGGYSSLNEETVDGNMGTRDGGSIGRKGLGADWRREKKER